MVVKVTPHFLFKLYTAFTRIHHDVLNIIILTSLAIIDVYCIRGIRTDGAGASMPPHDACDVVIDEGRLVK